MSSVRILAIKGNTLYQTQGHYRKSLQFLNSPITKQMQHLAKVTQKTYLDAGYVLIDFDKEILVNSQSAYSLFHLKKQKRELFTQTFRVIEEL